MGKKFFWAVAASVLLATSPVNANTEDKCTTSVCTGIDFLDNWDDEAFWLSRFDGAKKDLNSQINDSIEAAILNAALPYLGPFLPFLNLGNSGPTELDLAVEAILDSINQAETNVIDAIIAESTIQANVDWISIKNNATYYFSYPQEYRDTLYKNILDNLYLDITRLRYGFQIDRTHSNVNREFDTYNYDSFHTYLSIVALEILITIEHTRMTMIVDNPSVTANDIEDQVNVVLNDALGLENPNSPFNYISWLDTGWRQASDARFPTIKESNWLDIRDDYVSAGSYEAGYEPFINYKSLFSSDVSCFDESGGMPHYSSEWLFPFSSDSWSYPYSIEGEQYTAKVKAWTYSPDSFLDSVTCLVVENYLGDVVGATYFGPWVSQRDWVIEMSNAAILEHQEATYPEYLLKVYEPARDILDGWWALLGTSDDRPILKADRVLEHTYSTMFRQSINHSSIANYGTESSVWVEDLYGRRSSVAGNTPFSQLFSDYSIGLNVEANAYCDLLGYNYGSSSYQSTTQCNIPHMYIDRDTSSWRRGRAPRSRWSIPVCRPVLSSVDCNVNPEN